MDTTFTELFKQPEYKAVLANLGSNDRKVALDAQYFLAKAMQIPLRQGILSGDILQGIFSTIDFSDGRPVEFPLDVFAPGAEKDHVAYAIPNQGRIPSRILESNFVVLPTYNVGSSIGVPLRVVQFATWDIVGRLAEILEGGFVKKMNDDGFHVLLAAAVDRNINVFDSDAPAGTFTKRLVSLMKTIMRRNGGGNSTSLNRRKLTDIFLSPEAIEDIRNWNVDQVDPVTRRDIMISNDGEGLSSLYGVTLRILDELGVSQEYQQFYTNELAGTMGTLDEEIVIGLDLSSTSAFVCPVKSPVEIFTDETVHREQRMEWYGWGVQGFGCLESRNILIGSF